MSSITEGLSTATAQQIRDLITQTTSGTVRLRVPREVRDEVCHYAAHRRTHAKVLLWDGTGLCIYQKRIERGRFASMWRGDDEKTSEMTLSELALFFEGSTLVGALRLSPLPTSPEVLTSFLHETQRC